ncbi:hypothetical protein CVT24_004656 [Panaeolus cyanescens]|uniref:Uncharacterized protein n=1 Tax=Panaeolus cyanescens TaxID=181874 RepID=A0A409YSH0_9AGAR|nr:hypothetical protein CVT24_004656 [Panaeolus cyanescens]
MRLLFFVTIAITSASISALTLPPLSNLEGQQSDLERTVHSKRGYYDSSSSSSESPPPESGSPSSGSDHGPPPVITPDRLPSPSHSDHSASSSDHSASGEPRVRWSQEWHTQMEGLGAPPDSAADRAMKNEHLPRIKEHMKEIGATHAIVHKAAHAAGSTDSRVHITAQFLHPVKGPNGGVNLEPIPSHWTDAQGVTHKGADNRHHVVVNKAEPHKGAEYVAQHMTTYHKALQQKQKKTNPQLRRRSFQRRALIRAAAASYSL